MSFIDKVIYTLDETHSTYLEDTTKAIKDHINTLINAKSRDIDFLSLCDLDLNAKNLAVVMSNRIYQIISKYEHRARILSIEYDETLSPWQLNFFLRFCYGQDRFKEFSIRIIFRNNRYCEVL